MAKVSINSNLLSLMAQRQLGKASSEVGSIYERLSSGMRINKAADDAAGLSVSTMLNSQSRVFNQGVRNLNDGISLLNIADSAVENLSGILVRLKELAEQSANGVYAPAQRNALDKEAQALSSEYTRIIRTTSMNGKLLFSNDFGNLSLQAGYGTEGSIQSGLGGFVGTGTFSGITSFSSMEAISNDATSALGDVNGDGLLDLVSTGEISHISVQLGNGSGGFGASTTFLGGGKNIVLSDINNDGQLDIVSTDSNSLQSYLNNGNGTFTQAFSVISNGYTVAAADFNNDGFADLVNGSTILLGNGSGSFNSSGTFSFAGNSRSMNIYDVNNDGNLDILVSADTAAAGKIQISLGSGNGTFSSAISIELLSSTLVTHFELADLNNDGNLDIVGTGYEGTGVVVVSLGSSNGTFSSTVSYEMESIYSENVQLKDLNGDGIKDIVTLGLNDDDEAQVNVRLGRGDGSFGEKTTYNLGGQYADTLLADDLNGDGVIDLIARGTYTTHILIGQASSGIGSLIDFKLNNQANSLKALTQFSSALQRLTAQRGVIGSFQSRLNTAVNILQVTADNYKAAASRITDTDVAADAAALVRNKILQQAASSILAQANQQPALALRLLK